MSERRSNPALSEWTTTTLGRAPTDESGDLAHHLHIESYPADRAGEAVKYGAGSELGAGAFIGHVLPERTAPKLRELASAALSPDAAVESEVARGR